jgi:hypothetical protein
MTTCFNFQLKILILFVQLYCTCYQWAPNALKHDTYIYIRTKNSAGRAERLIVGMHAEDPRSMHTSYMDPAVQLAWVNNSFIT